MEHISKRKFSELVPKPVFDIAAVLKEHSYQAYLVGGSVRDILLGKEPHDFDIATDAVPDTLLDLFPKSIEVGAKFGTVIVLSSKKGLDDITGESEEYQVTMFRKDAEYINGRWPLSVTFSKTIEEDLARRDFTMNALAINLLAIEAAIHEGKDLDTDISPYIIDLFGGIADLGNGIIKAVGNPYDRMAEDGLRSMRACRFAAQLEFTIEHETFNAIKAASTSIDQISMERIRDEFIKTLPTSKPSVGIELMRRANILEKFIPELLEGVGMEQNEFHVHDVYTHLLQSCDVADRRVRLAALLHDIGKSRTKDGPHFYGHEHVGAEMVKGIMTRMKFPNAEIDHVVKLVDLHMFYYLPEWSDSAIRRFLAKVGDDETLKDLFLLRIADAESNPKNGYIPDELKELERRIATIRQEEHALHIKDLKLNGNDIIQELHVTNGPDIGRILSELLERVLEDPSLNTHDRLIEIGKTLI